MIDDENSLYRYRTVNEFLAPILEECELFCAKLATLNDPNEGFYNIDFSFDEAFCRLIIRNTKEILRRQGKFEIGDTVREANKGVRDLDAVAAFWRQPEDQILEIQRKRIWTEQERAQFRDSLKKIDEKEVSVCCFTKTFKSTAMSNHYGNQHRGVCLEFDRRVSPMNEATPVIYSEEMPTLRFYSSPMEQVKARALYKSTDWAYENEWRILGNESKYNNKYTFAPEGLRSIGLLPSISEQDRHTVFELVASHNRYFNRELPVFELTLQADKYGWSSKRIK